MKLTLTIIMLLPLIGAAIIAVTPAAMTTLVKQIALATTVVVAIATIVKALSFNTENTALQFRQSYSWIPSFAINWGLGVDGIALVLILMSVVLVPVVILAGWNESEGGRWGVKTFYILILVLETMMIGVFAASGSHVWNGHNGALIAKAMKNPRKRMFCVVLLIDV